MFTSWPLTLPTPALKHRHPYHHYPFHLQRAWLSEGLPRWHGGKEFTCQCKRHGIDPWVRKISWRRKWQLTPVFLPGKSHGQKSWAGGGGLGWRLQSLGLKRIGLLSDETTIRSHLRQKMNLIALVWLQT